VSDPYSLRQEDKTDERVREVLSAAFMGNHAAVQFMLDLMDVVHTWDDLIDRDREVDPGEVHQAFTAAMVGFNLNPFFRAHAHVLTPVLLNGILNWHAANELEATQRPECLSVAHVIRCAIGDVAMVMAYLIGGMPYAQVWAARLRMLTQQDSLYDYIKDFDHEAA
jgi:hypothetical protein